MDQKDIEICEKISKEIIKNVENRLEKHFGNKESGKFVKIGADGTPTNYIDLVAEEEVIKVLKNADFVSLLISEEIGEMKLGKGLESFVRISEESEKLLDKETKIEDEPRFIFLVDPLDGTSNAIKNIPAYGISIAVVEIPDGKIATLEDVKLGFIKNFANGNFYEAVKGKGSKINGKKMEPTTETNLNKISIGGFVKSSNLKIPNLLKKVRRMRILGSVVLELVYIANGKYDAFFDLRGSRIIDISASKLIAEESGAIVTDEYGNKLNNKLSIYEKTIVIGASNKELHEKIIKFINNDESKPMKKIGVVSRLDNYDAILFAAKIIQRLNDKDISISIEPSLVTKLEEIKKSDNLENILKYISNTKPKVFEELAGLKLNLDFTKYAKSISKFDSDIVITLGGDGTILRTQNQLSDNEIPILGINMGTVGFLTEIDTEHAFKSLESILQGNYYREKRTQLKISHGSHIFTALNEVVIMTEKPAKMLNFEVRVDGDIIEEFRADGLILSTPSGSTAYSMSAGGPIVDPKVRAFIIIPICPYKLGLRPIVVSDSSEIAVKLMKKGKKAVFVMDGQISEEVDYLEEIKFVKSENDVYFIRTLNETFYNRVKEKLTDGGIDLGKC
ncbi:NAD kinase [Methanobrevibacter cuticularis]|uniref:NAD kinase n=1 Tax=Methanobrevibacter cuticularis TaxID=47311 RepID=A0A166CKC8_9EURY|nr:bifunctional NADP phosphatase/NAD kinase [Methanobrevibacter cuticularis]KZX15007.1 NAD kinase [Methanobrevibacter cuticularis]